MTSRLKRLWLILRLTGAGNIRPSRLHGGGPGKEVIPFSASPPAVRKIIYTTNAIESLNSIRQTTVPHTVF